MLTFNQQIKCCDFKVCDKLKQLAILFFTIHSLPIFTPYSVSLSFALQRKLCQSLLISSLIRQKRDSVGMQSQFEVFWSSLINLIPAIPRRDIGVRVFRQSVRPSCRASFSKVRHRRPVFHPSVRRSTRPSFRSQFTSIIFRLQG